MSYRARAYPYPVLSSFSNDFGADARFEAQMTLEVDETDAQKLSLGYDIGHSSPWLDEYIIDQQAELVLDVECRATLLREHVRLPGFKGRINFRTGQLYGAVSATPLIVSRTDNPTYRPEGIDSEFGSAVFDVKRGDILGVGESITFDLEFARTLERDLITIQYSDDGVERDAYKFELSGERITIIASESLRDVIGQMRASATLRPYLYMSIYKDCIAAALDFLVAEGDLEGSERPWSRALVRKLDAIDRTLEGDGPEYRQVSSQLLVANYGVRKVEATNV